MNHIQPAQLTPRMSPDLVDLFAPARVLEGWTPWQALTPPAGQGGALVLRVDPQAPPGARSFPTLHQALACVLERGDPVPHLRIELAPGRHKGPVVVPPMPGTRIDICGARGTEIEAATHPHMSEAQAQDAFGALFAEAGPRMAAIGARLAARDRLGTDQCAVLRIEASDVTLRDLALRNSYNCDRDVPDDNAVPVTRNAAGQFSNETHQAPALMVAAGADRVALINLSLTSWQDTLYLDGGRVWAQGCSIAGDVDFVFGGATAVFDACCFVSRAGRSPNSWVFAPSTLLQQPYGFVCHDCRFVDGGWFPGAAKLGRQWFRQARQTPYGTGAGDKRGLEHVGKCALLGCQIGAHIDRDSPWDAWKGPERSAAGGVCLPAAGRRQRPVQYGLPDMHALLPAPMAADLPQTLPAPGATFLVSHNSRFENAIRGCADLSADREFL